MPEYKCKLKPSAFSSTQLLLAVLTFGVSQILEYTYLANRLLLE